MASQSEDNNVNVTETNLETDGFDLKNFLYICLSKWYWFLISLAVCMGIGYFYLLKQPNIYTRSADVMIKTSRNSGGSSSNPMLFGDFDMLSTRSTISNEIVVFKSPDLIRDVVRRLHLDMNYSVKGKFHNYVLYGKNLPLTASISGLSDNDYVGFKMQASADSVVTLFDFSGKGISEADADKVIKAKLSQTVKTPIGDITVIPTETFGSYKAGTLPIAVRRTSIKNATNIYRSKLQVIQGKEKTDILKLTANDISPERAEDFINCVLAVYNQNWINDRNKIAIATSEFIDDRLGVIESELGNVESDISDYKSSNLMPDAQALASMYLGHADKADAALMDLNTQVSMVKYIRDFLTNATEKKFQLLPANTGLSEGGLSSQIAAYNAQLLERNTLVANSSDQNPLVVDIDAILENMRIAMLQSIDNELQVLNAKIKSQRQYEGRAISNIAANPNKEKYLLSVERQQKVKESLYLYLLQRREENELSQAFTAYNTRVITRPEGPDAPISPVRKRILMIAALIGLAIPIIILYLSEILNTKVRGRADIEKLSAPFIGEIPQAPEVKRSRLPRFLCRKRKDDHKIVIKRDNRNIINEAFRVVRTNLDMIISRDPQKHVIAVTSFNPGSGKSFISMNLAVSLAIKGKRVLVIDGDLRHGSLSTYVNSPKIGMSEYLCGKVNDVSRIMVQIPDHPTLDVIPTGKIPPNPTELLEDVRFKGLIDKLRDQYDYIFIDCPPLDIVADTNIIERQTDRTIFIVRTGVLERDMLKDVELIYRNNKLKNLTVVLNGTQSSGSKYGYRYGYKYGYYGYYGNKTSSYYSKDE